MNAKDPALRDFLTRGADAAFEHLWDNAADLLGNPITDPASAQLFRRLCHVFEAAHGVVKCLGANDRAGAAQQAALLEHGATELRRWLE